MIGGLFGGTDGIAPGCKASLSWWKLELYSEGEYVFDVSGSSDSFFYSWSELTIAPVSWFRAGTVTQRTRVYETDRDIQRGFLVGFSHKALSVTTCVFNRMTVNRSWCARPASHFDDGGCGRPMKFRRTIFLRLIERCRAAEGQSRALQSCCPATILLPDVRNRAPRTIGRAGQ